jgi:CRISPR/Cas system-associated protein Cas10 (large subunit of type III CRISPR-Cas system)
MNVDRHIKQGIHCPVCGSTSIEGDFLEQNNNYVEQRAYCNSCEASWDDVYKLVKIENVEFGKKYQVLYDNETVGEYANMGAMKREILDRFSDGVVPHSISAYNPTTDDFDIEISLNWDIDFVYLG